MNVRRGTAQRLLIEHKLLIVVVIVGAFVSFNTTNFLTFENIKGIFSDIDDQGLIVIGMAMLIILGEIDLSVGSIMALGAVVSIVLEPYGVVVAVVASLGVGAGFGLVNGLIITKMRLSSIGVTLGTMIFLSGVVFGITKEHTITGTNARFAGIAETHLFGVPLPIVLFLVLVAIFEIVLQRSFFGRSIFATGGNQTASRVFGLKVDRIRILCFTIAGFLSGLAGVIVAAKLNIASGTIGTNTAVLVITAVLLGGVSLLGGEGSIVGAFEGILLIGTLNNAMVLLGISPFIQQMVQGLLLILIVSIDAANSQRKRYL